jgi:hypothetical protein
MKRVHKQLVAALALTVAFAGVAQAATATYSYTATNKWEVAANWNTGLVPGDDGAGGLSTDNIIIVGNSQVTFDAATWTYLGANSLLYSTTEYRGGLRLLMGENTSGSANGSHSLTFDHGAGNLVNFTTGSSQAIGSRAGKTSTLNMNSGIVNIGGNPFNIGGAGNGILNLNGGSFIAGRSAPNLGTGAGNGEINIAGGSFTTRAGLTVGANGTLHVIGSGATEIGLGSDNNLDGEYIQLAGGTLKADIDAGGITKIFVDDNAEGTVQANFAAGSILDLGFDSGFSTASGTWTLLEVANADITGNPTLSAASQSAGWTFNIDNSGPNGILTVSIPEPATLGMIAMMGGGLLFIRRRFMM